MGEDSFISLPPRTSQLEKYSTNLEAIVAERTSELEAEKAKTEDLVCRMLPRAIAMKLTRGETIDAETFECVTIYFRSEHGIYNVLYTCYSESDGVCVHVYMYINLHCMYVYWPQ